jgi:hypothetical protein
MARRLFKIELVYRLSSDAEDAADYSGQRRGRAISPIYTEKRLAGKRNI